MISSSGIVCATQEWNEKLSRKWLKLRETVKVNKKEKNWVRLINTCEEIIQLDSQARIIGIMTPFLKSSSVLASVILVQIVL